MVVGDGAPIPLASPGPMSPSLATVSSLLEAARGRLHGLAGRGLVWHLHSSATALPILAVLYAYWVPRGSVEGVDRRVILSKGHASLGFYVLLEEMGLLERGSVERLFARPGSPLQAHPEAGRTPLTLVSNGSLGQALSVANGLVIGSRLKGERVEVAVVLGDGELDEGQVWEAASTAAAMRLREVVAIIDRNRVQHTGETEAIKPKEPLEDRWRSFGWEATTVAGRVEEIAGALDSRAGDRPTVIIVESVEE
ncbi:1-deoxy-D-xylulose-5-phosphate synthase N-terminal domain-containing protein [Aeropyrum pernix]|nr:1-deoxy-D-xylulose-5-phosphate synthase N-terminal domain-containing protein [Aeropyrum pernix]